MANDTKTVAIGLSGGVDSSISALLLKEQGYKVIGITMKLWSGKYNGGEESGCFGPGEGKNIELASSFASSIGIDYKVFDCSKEYEENIISYFRETYSLGKTPNPCVRCNAMIKFGLLPLLAKKQISFDYFATGHYAIINRYPNGRYGVQRAVDEKKDQSYFLYRLTQEQLSRHIFPLGHLKKEDVRAMALKHNLAQASRPDSQDFYTGDLSELIGIDSRPGKIVDQNGKILGMHNGYWNYTIGQRKGLCIGGAGEPYYVIDINSCKNEVVVGRHRETIKYSLEIEDIIYQAISPEDVQDVPIPGYIKVRSGGIPKGPAFLQGNKCTFPEGISGIAPGQSAVFYNDKGQILLGGIIK